MYEISRFLPCGLSVLPPVCEMLKLFIVTGVSYCTVWCSTTPAGTKYQPYRTVAGGVNFSAIRRSLWAGTNVPSRAIVPSSIHSPENFEHPLAANNNRHDAKSVTRIVDPFPKRFQTYSSCFESPRAKMLAT